MRRYYNMQIVNYVREATAAFLKHSNMNRELRAEAAGCGGTVHVTRPQRREKAGRRAFSSSAEPV